MTISGHHKKISINALSNLIRYLAYVAITFLLTPFIIKSLGESAYGLWVVILSVVGYAGIMEMGVQTAVVKLVAQYHGTGDTKRLNEVVGAALVFFLSLGILIALVCWLVLPLFVDKLVNEPSGRETVRHLFIILGINILFIFPNYVFSGMVFGFQVYHLKNLIDVGSLILNALMVYFLLLRGYGIFALAVIKVVSDIFCLVASYALSKKVFPELRISIFGISRELYREIFSLGGKIFSSATMARLATNSEPLIISYALSTAWTAVFSIPKRLIDYIKEISWSLTTGFMPMFSEMTGRNDNDGVRNIYFQYTRYVVILVAPLLAAVFAYGAVFVHLWIGKDFAEKGRMLIYLMSAAFLVESLQPLIWRMFIGVNKVDFLVKIYSISSFAYMVLAFSLIWKFGVNGVAVSGLIVNCICQIIFFIHTARFLNTSVSRYFRECHMMPLAITTVSLAFMLWLKSIWPPVSYGVLVPHVVFSLSVYAVMCWFLALKDVERTKAVEFMRTRCAVLLQEK